MVHPLFEVFQLNERGKGKANQIALAFDNLLKELRSVIYGGDSSPVATREFSVTQTKLEEACFFAKKAMAMRRENQQS